MKPPGGLQHEPLYSPRSWVEPLQWDEIFLSQQPLEVDLGCGKGSFLLWAARSRPDTNFLGVDRLLGRLQKAAAKIIRTGTPNARLLRIEGGYFVRYLVSPGTVAAYHIYFPDPWPKRRHRERRLFNGEFVHALERTLGAAGVVNVATDDGDYAAAMEQLMDAGGWFTAEPPQPIPLEGQTEFERTFMQVGCPIHRRRWRKRAR